MNTYILWVILRIHQTLGRELTSDLTVSRGYNRNWSASFVDYLVGVSIDISLYYYSVRFRVLRRRNHERYDIVKPELLLVHAL